MIDIHSLSKVKSSSVYPKLNSTKLTQSLPIQIQSIPGSDYQKQSSIQLAYQKSSIPKV